MLINSGLTLRPQYVRERYFVEGTFIYQVLADVTYRAGVFSRATWWGTGFCYVSPQIASRDDLKIEKHPLNNSWAQSHSSLKKVVFMSLTKSGFPVLPKKTEARWTKLLESCHGAGCSGSSGSSPRETKKSIQGFFDVLSHYLDEETIVKEAGIFGVPNFTENPLDGSGGLNFRVAWGGSRFGSGTSWLSVTKRSTFADWEVVTSCFL